MINTAVQRRGKSSTLNGEIESILSNREIIGRTASRNQPMITGVDCPEDTNMGQVKIILKDSRFTMASTDQVMSVSEDSTGDLQKDSIASRFTQANTNSEHPVTITGDRTSTSVEQLDGCDTYVMDMNNDEEHVDDFDDSDEVNGDNVQTSDNLSYNGGLRGDAAKDLPDVDVSKIGLMMKSIFDFQTIKKLLSSPEFTFRYDALHGVVGAYAKRIFVEELGAKESYFLSCVPKEDFGGGHPDTNLTYAKEPQLPTLDRHVILKTETVELLVTDVVNDRPQLILLVQQFIEQHQWHRGWVKTLCTIRRIMVQVDSLIEKHFVHHLEVDGSQTSKAIFQPSIPTKAAASLYCTNSTIQLSFGVKEFVVIAPQSASGLVLDAPEARKLLRAIAIALSNRSCLWPAIVPVHDSSRKETDQQIVNCDKVMENGQPLIESDGFTLSAKEERLGSIVTTNSWDFNAWTTSIDDRERISEHTISLVVRKLYDKFLAGFSLYRGYAKTYGDHEASLYSVNKVAKIYDYLHRQEGTFKLPDLFKVAIDVSKGMNCEHPNNIIHMDLRAAMIVHVYFLGSVHKDDFALTNKVLDMYSKYGSVRLTRSIFAHNVDSTMVYWHLMITGYAANRLGDEGVAVFEQMQPTGSPLNGETSLAVLKAGANADAIGAIVDAIEERFLYFFSLKPDHSSIAYYVRCLGVLRTSLHLADVEGYIESLPFESIIVFWEEQTQNLSLDEFCQTGRAVQKGAEVILWGSIHGRWRINDLFLLSSLRTRRFLTGRELIRAHIHHNPSSMASPSNHLKRNTKRGWQGLARGTEGCCDSRSQGRTSTTPKETPREIRGICLTLKDILLE